MSRLIVTAEKLVFGGDCLARIKGESSDGKVIFVSGLIPGESAEIEIIASKKNFHRGKLVSILEPSSHRVAPPCSYYPECGGCNLLHVSSDFQVTLRQQVLEDIFQREGIPIPVLQTLGGEPLGYRCRMQLTNGGLQQRGKAHSPIPITNCPCGTAEINRWLQQVPFEQRHQGRIQIFGDSRIQSEDKFFWASTEKEKAVLQVTGKTSRKLQDKVKRRFSGTSLSAATTCTLQISPKKYKPKILSFDVRGFFQSNLGVLEQTIDVLLDYLQEIKSKRGRLSHALDIYSGAGTMSVFLADYFDLVSLVEHNRDALVFAEQNLLGTNHQSFGLSGERWAREFGTKVVESNLPELAFVDPPRSGMEGAVRNFLAQGAIPHIAYLSCDPATQARDCKTLVQAGYTITRLFLLDFYPNTGHLETLVFLEK